MHGDGEAHDGGAQVEALHHPASRGGQQNGADETAGKDRNVVKMCQRHVVSPPEVGGDNHHTWAELGGEEDTREASGKEAYAECCGEGGRLEEDLIDTNHHILQAIIPGRPGGSACTNLLGGELVWATKSKCKALALKDALDAAGETEEEEGEQENQIWIFHFFSLLLF